ncbi:MAG: TonB-dependent receptor domain-containing protein, partial [Candidatus Binatia bacterium]
ASHGRFDTTYGNPGEPDAGVFIDLDQKRYDVAAGLRRSFGIFSGLDLRLGTTDYDHVEIEGGETGTTFLNDSDEARVALPHRKLGAFSGTIGAQYFRREFSALGEEAFVPPTETENWAAFLFEEAGEGDLRFQLGLRYENQVNSARAFPAEAGEEPEPAPQARSFSAISASTGLVWSPGETWGLAISVSRSEKLPNAEELYSNGPHLATAAFEIGDPSLDKETSLGVEASLRKRSGRLKGALTLFANRFDDYIFERFTDEFVAGEEDELRVVRFEQTDAEFRGAELEGHFDLVETDAHHLELEATADFVRAEERGSGDPLPRIPPRRFSLGLRYQGPHLFGSVRGRSIAEQDR